MTEQQEQQAILDYIRNSTNPKETISQLKEILISLSQEDS